MRASEFITETINPDILNPNFHHEQEINGMIYSAKTGPMSKGGKQLYLTIECRDPKVPNRIAGMAVFIIMHTRKGDWLESMDTYVVGDYKMSGIASTIYAYAKMLGNDVRPSTVQMPAGKAMWKAWKKSGEYKHLVSEDINSSEYVYHASYLQN